jgi:hypothetical protein
MLNSVTKSALIAIASDSILEMLTFSAMTGQKRRRLSFGQHDHFTTLLFDKFPDLR